MAEIGLLDAGAPFPLSPQVLIEYGRRVGTHYV